MRRMLPMTRWLLGGAALLVCFAPASAQTGTTGTGTGTTTTGRTSTGTTGTTGTTGAGFVGGTGFTGGTGTTGTAGAMGFTGGTGYTGGTGTTGTGRTGGLSGARIPTSFNPFNTYYINPMSMGLGTTSTGTAGKTTGTFGQPIYGTTTATTTGAGTGQRTTTNTNTAVGFSTIGIRKNTPFVTTLAEDLPLVTHTLVRTDLQAVLERSSMLKSKNGIAVEVDGPVVVLRGEVASDRERRLAEGILRLSPGVREVRNELRVK